MSIAGVLKRRVRGFRVIDLAALVVFLALALTVYAFKTSAGSQREGIADVEGDIASESARVRLLRAEIAHLENPVRLERLSRAYAGQAPVATRQEVTAEDLARVASSSPPGGGSTAEGREGGTPTSAGARLQTPSTPPGSHSPSGGGFRGPPPAPGEDFR